MSGWYIVDTETVGLKRPPLPASGVVEVGAIQIDPDTLAILSTGEARTNPGCPIEPGATGIHGITDDDVKDCPPLEEVWGDDEPIWMGGHNHKYDYEFLAPYCGNILGGFCTLEMARQWLRGPANYKLQTLVQYYNLPTGKAHSAMGDCISTYHLILLIVKESGKTFRELVTASNQVRMIHVMPFGRYKGKSIMELPNDYIRWFVQQDISGSLRYSFEQARKVRGIDD